jgi:peroxiredoxin
MAAMSMDEAFARAATLEGSLSARLKMVADAFRALAPASMEAIDRLATRLESAAVGAGAPTVGEPMPAFLLPDEDGRLVSLTEVLASGPAAICFVRGHWCPYCRLNVFGLHDIEAEVANLGARLVVIAPEKREYAKALKQEARATFPILCDMDAAYALSLNLVFWVGAELERILKDSGKDIGAFYGNNSYFLPVPSAFVLRRDGTIAWRHIDPDYRRRSDLGELVAALASAR